MHNNDRLIMIVIDGLRNDTAKTQMGWMEHLVEKGIAKRGVVRSELPSLSRPLYETLLTGVPPHTSGIVNNMVVRNSYYPSLFHLVKQKGGVTAAAAYHWVSELYNRAPFDLVYDREQHNPQMPIMHGKFYFDDAYPDSHLFGDAEILRKRYEPDFLYIHSMGMDDIGHKHGGESAAYRNHATHVDSILAHCIGLWLQLGYQIVVTSDHGMNADGNHGGTTDAERLVPLYVMTPKHIVLDEPYMEQQHIARFMCQLLGVQPSEHMAFWVPKPVQYQWLDDEEYSLPDSVDTSS
ncbi:MAG: alkaline phosphatase family protein [Bacilli bacterium]